MFHLADIVQTHVDERVEAVFRRHRLTLVGPLFLATMLIVIPSFFLFSLPQIGALGLVLFLVLIAFGFGCAFRTLFVWDANALIITNHRIVQVIQQGFLHRTVHETMLRSIHDLRCESQGFFETFFRMGSIHIRASNSLHELSMTRVAVPKRVRETIDRLREPLLKTAPPAPAGLSSDLRTRVHALVDRAALTTLETVQALLEK